LSNYFLKIVALNRFFEKPDVSVIIASYNHGKYIAGTIRSVLSQKGVNLELLIADDGSTDDSVKVIKSFSDPRLKAFFFERNREISMRNHCLKIARGKYIAILNSDDEFLPDKLRLQAELLDRSPQVGAVFAKVNFINDAGKKIPANHEVVNYYSKVNYSDRSRFEWLRDFFHGENSLIHPTVMMHRKINGKTSFYNPFLALSGDLDLWVKMCLSAEIRVLPRALLNLRIHDNKSNAGAKSEANKYRFNYEFFKILENFVAPNALKQLTNIFPGLKEQIRTGSSAERRLLLAKIALQLNSPSHHLFALEQMYQLLGDERERRKMDKIFGEPFLKTFISATALPSVG